MEGGRAGEKHLRERETWLRYRWPGPWQGTNPEPGMCPAGNGAPDLSVRRTGPTHWAAPARAAFRFEDSVDHCWQQQSPHLVRDSWVPGCRMGPEEERDLVQGRTKLLKKLTSLSATWPNVTNTGPGHLTMELETTLKIQLVRLTEPDTGVGAAASVIRRSQKWAQECPGLVRKPSRWPRAQCHLPVLQDSGHSCACCHGQWVKEACIWTCSRMSCFSNRLVPVYGSGQDSNKGQWWGEVCLLGRAHGSILDPEVFWKVSDLKVLNPYISYKYPIVFPGSGRGLPSGPTCWKGQDGERLQLPHSFGVWYFLFRLFGEVVSLYIYFDPILSWFPWTVFLCLLVAHWASPK